MATGDPTAGLVTGGTVRARWKHGPATAAGGRVYVNVTDLRLLAPEEAAAVENMGLDLRRMWPEVTGAIGLWLWARPEEHRSGSVSVWSGATDLRRFVRSTTHIAVMERFRDVVAVTSTGWPAAPSSPDEVWADAQERLAGSALAL